MPVQKIGSTVKVDQPIKTETTATTTTTGINWVHFAIGLAVVVGVGIVLVKFLPKAAVKA